MLTTRSNQLQCQALAAFPYPVTGIPIQVLGTMTCRYFVRDLNQYYLPPTS